MPDVQDIVAEVLRDDEYVLGTFGDTGPQGEKGDQGDTGPQGPAGPSNVLSIGTVIRGDDAEASITGTSPNQILNLTLPKGDTGEQGPEGPEGPAGFTPIANVTKSGDTITISITDKNGTTTESFTSYQEPLLSYKWSDHIINNISWLRADTFSWQSGDVYTSVYNHLVDDIDGKTAQTETVGSYTITYYLADDGHKIVLADQENTVSNIYAESGVAWYYILDTENTRFKLPRSRHGNIVEKKQNGTQWYRVYSDGWCEQGGITGLIADYGTATVNLLKSFADTNYTITKATMMPSTGDDSSYNDATCIRYATRTISSFQIYNRGATNGGRYVSWQAEGYLSSYPANSQYKYLYFYCGNFEQSAIEQTAGLNSELFNGKADLNLNNIISADKVLNALAADMDSFTTIASSTTFTAPSAGWINFAPGGNTDTSISLNTGGTGGYIQIEGKTVLTTTYAHGSDSGHADSGWFFIGKNQTCYHTMNSGVVYFYPCKGV